MCKRVHTVPLQTALSTAFVPSYIILTIALRGRQCFPLHLTDENIDLSQVTQDLHTGSVTPVHTLTTLQFVFYVFSGCYDEALLSSRREGINN